VIVGVTRRRSLSLDLNRQQAVLDGGRVALTPREFAILRALMERPGRLISGRALLSVNAQEPMI
jgi:DNA-binding response OmpR family regulator